MVCRRMAYEVAMCPTPPNDRFIRKQNTPRGHGVGRSVKQQKIHNAKVVSCRNIVKHEFLGCKNLRALLKRLSAKFRRENEPRVDEECVYIGFTSGGIGCWRRGRVKRFDITNTNNKVAKTWVVIRRDYRDQAVDGRKGRFVAVPLGYAFSPPPRFRCVRE